MPVTVCSVLRWLISVVYCVLYRLLFYSWIIVILKKIKTGLKRFTEKSQCDLVSIRTQSSLGRSHVVTKFHRGLKVYTNRSYRCFGA